jgi:hydrogenase maturation factor
MAAILLSTALPQRNRSAIAPQFDFNQTGEPHHMTSTGGAAACEILGLDPFHVANEGCFVAFVTAQNADAALAILRTHEQRADAARIGSVVAGKGGRVACRCPIGGTRTIDMLSGEQLPRIC